MIARRQIVASLINRWSDFFSYLAKQKDPKLAELSAICENGIDYDKHYCPIHTGESGEAFRFFDDAQLTGGCVCNSCGGFADGFALLERLVGKTKAFDYAQSYFKERNIVPCRETTGKRLNEFLLSTDIDIAGNYLAKRGIPITADKLPASIRGNRSFEVFGPRGERYGTNPVMMTLIKSAKGEPATYQMIVLNGTHEKSKDIPPAHVKRTAGIKKELSLKQSYADIGDEFANTLVLCEGVETGLAVKYAFDQINIPVMVWASLGGGGKTFTSYKYPEHVKTVFIAADADAVPAIQKSLNDGKQTILGGDAQVYLCSPEIKNHPKRDFLDVLVEDGADAILHSFADSHSLDEKRSKFIIERSAQIASKVMNSQLGSGAVIDLDSLSDAYIYRMFDRSILENPPTHWYVYGGQIVELREGILTNPSNHAIAAEIDERFVFFNHKHQRCPLQLVRKWFERGSLKTRLKEVLPETQGIAKKPTPVLISGDESLEIKVLCGNKLDEKTKLLMQVPEDENDLWESSSVKGRLMAWGVFQSVMSDLFGDFKFDTTADKMNAIGALFSPLIAEMVGTVPFIVVDAPMPGTGKTTLARVMTSAWGGTVDVEYDHNEAEFSKKLATAFISSKPLILLDNLTGRINSDNLKRLITSPREMGLRVLGKNEQIYPPAGLVVYGTANNPEIQEEVVRRILPIRLNARMENPASRSDFKRNNIDEWVKKQANTIRRVTYSVFKAWLADQAPIVKSPVAFTGFERWADITYSLLLYLGLEDADQFLANRAERLSTSDPEQQEAKAFIEFWLDKYGNEYVNAKQLLGLAEKHKTPTKILISSAEATRTRDLRGWLRDMKDRIICGHQIVEREHRTANSRVQYALEPIVSEVE